MAPSLQEFKRRIEERSDGADLAIRIDFYFYGAIAAFFDAALEFLRVGVLNAAFNFFKGKTPLGLCGGIVAVGCVAGAAVPGTGRQQRENSECRHGARKKSVHANNLG